MAKNLTIPVIGIGAGGGVDGQVLVTHDMLGMTHEFSPRFLRRYLNLYESMGNAFKQYITDVKNKDLVESQQRTIDKLESDIRNNKRRAPDDNNRDPRRYSFNNHRE